MSYFYKSVDKDAIKAFIYEDLKVLGIKIPKLDKIAKASCLPSPQQQLQQQVNQQQEQQPKSPDSVRRVTKCKRRETAVFGVPISLMDVVEETNIGQIPQFLVSTRQYLSKHLDREGLFRKTGSVSRQKDLAQQIEENGGECMNGAQVYDVTSVVKQFFRAMPEPVIPHILQDAFVQAVQLNAEDTKIYSLALLCLLLPDEHLSVFRYTLEILSDVSSNSKVNKMNAHNLAVCLTPNIFHTKQNSKQLDLQTEAVKLCIENAINIGVVPPSIAEKVVMLRSLEANEMENSATLENSAVSGTSIRKKRRSGSLHGIVGSIRRSVEKMRSRASRRSSSVPGNLNVLDTLNGFTDGEGSAMDIDVSGPAPQIMKKSLSGESAGFSAHKRKAIMSQSSLLGTPLAKMSIRSNSTDNVFESPTQNSMLSNQTLSSMNSTKAEDSRMGTPGKKKSWGVLRSPFTKRKRSVSAGPALSPRRTRSSSRTKKLVRRLTGGKRKTPDMVGQRLAFSNEEDVASVRQRMPSAPTSLNFNTSAGGEGESVASNQQFISNLRANLLANSPELQCNPLNRMHTQRESSRPKATLRRRAKSADNKALRRGRPNHPLMGLNRVKTRAMFKDESESSLYADVDADNTQISAPVDSPHIPTNAPLIDVPASRLHCNNQSSPSMDNDGQSNAVTRERSSRSRVTSRTPRINATGRGGSTFDRRLVNVASLHEDMFSIHPVPRQQSAGRSTQRSATFSHSCRSAAEGRPPKPHNPLTQKKPRSDSKLIVHSSSQANVASKDSGASRHNSSGSVSGKSSKSSLVSTDSGICEGGTEAAAAIVEACSAGSTAADVQMRDIEERVVIGGNEKHCSQVPAADDNHTRRISNHPLTVMGAQLQTVTHAGSISNLHQVSRVKQSKRLFDQPINSDTQSGESVNGEMAGEAPMNEGPCKVTNKPPRQAPVRIPTVFAKHDPRAMRYKMAADAVRRRSLQKAKCAEQGIEEATPHRGSMVMTTDMDCCLADSTESGTTQTHPGLTSAVVSMKVPQSPPHRQAFSVGGLSPLPSSRLHNSQANAHIPISTDIVRGAVDSPLRKVLTAVVTTDRLPLREHSPNIDRQLLSTPKIKAAMLPLDHIKSARRQTSMSASRKSPRARVGSQLRVAPYSTTPSRVAKVRTTTSAILKDTAL